LPQPAALLYSPDAQQLPATLTSWLEAHAPAIVVVRDAEEMMGAALRGRPRLAVAAFVAGGRAAFDAIDRAGGDVSAGPPRATRAARGRALLRVLLGREAGRSPAGEERPEADQSSQDAGLDAPRR
jgi:hypothetical protein